MIGMRRGRMRHRLVLVAAMAASIAASLLPGGVVLAAAAPNTIIDSAPASPTASPTATFTFHSTRSGSTFKCGLDGVALTSCTSPKGYTGLAQGSHTFRVAATSKGATDPTPATVTWTVDTTAPTIPTNLAASTPTATSVKLTWGASTDNLAVTGYDVFRDGALLMAVAAVTTYTDPTVIAGSTHTYALRARDGAGNLSALTGTISVTLPTAPDTFIDSAPPAGTPSTDASFSFHSDQAGATFTCTLDGGTASGCSSPKSYTGLAQGVHAFTVRAALGGVADPTPATATWTVDTTAPSSPTGLTASAPSPTSVQLTWTASTDNVAVTGYDILRDGALLTIVGAVTTYTDPTVAAGSTHTYALQAFDLAGNRSPMTAPVSPPPPPTPLDPHLTRMPYLTDLVGLNAIVNFATDRSGTTASVSFGPAVGGLCSLTMTVPASARVAISVNSVLEYQWKANLSLPTTGPFCYRAYLGTADLLGANLSPTFTTQVPVGSPETFSFAVFGDWGETDATGANVNQANVMRQIAASGARFAITTGDNGYPSGSQGDYGDLQQAGSSVFGMPFWGGVGSTLALFPVIGNHGLARNDASHPHLLNWPQDTAVATSGGRYQVDTYCCPNGATSANYPSPWYAFSAGNARFYMLAAAWPDGNVGTGSAYGADYLAHWTTTSPEYLWLQADLAAHPSGLKFAFFHYPLFSDQPTENSDTNLQGNASLEGLLASNGVNIAFNGHAHIYQRNTPATGPGRNSLISYVTGGGGAQAQSTGTCSSNDAYAVGWSYTNSRGTACGSAPIPTSPAQVHHFLKVTISGSSVTVTPIDSSGQPFDVQTYTFNPKPDTVIDSGPAGGTTSTSATFAFHATSGGATFTCQIDGGAAASCASPTDYTGLADGSHTFTVYATVGGVADPLPANRSWTIDTVAPGAPTSFVAGATSPFSVALSWNAATDNLAVAGYEVYRDGSLLATLGPVTAYTDTTVLGSSTHTYAIRAYDVARNVSAFTPAIQVTTPAVPVPVFADGFESGDLSAWTSTSGLAVQGATVHGGTYAAEAATTAGAAYAKKTLPATYSDAYARVWFDVKSQVDQVNLLRLRDANGASIGYLYLTQGGVLGFHNDATATNTLSGTAPGPGWHALELHVNAAGASGVVDVWLDNERIAGLSSASVNTGTSLVAAFQIGEVQTAQTYDVVYDDAAFGTSRLGPVADGAPTVPTNLVAATPSPTAVALTWTASTDDIGVVGYDVFRDGSLLAGLGNVTAYSDSSVTAGSTHTYAVRARDTSGNRSALTPTVSATTPAAPVPVFADGFESGNLSAWTSTGGLAVELTDIRSGTYAAEGNTTVTAGPIFARRSLPATYPDAYARVGFLVKNLPASQITLLRLRAAGAGTGPGSSIGYIYITSAGNLYFRADAAASAIQLSATSGAGWHVLELHLGVSGTSSIVQVWLDGSSVGGLPTTVDLGPATAVGQLQVGDTASVTAGIVFDDAAFGTSRLGL